MKFLFAATINHQELSAKIAQAFAEIGGVLPEMDFIASKLYPTEMIRLTLAHVYAQILEFCIRATRWYNDVRRSYLKKVFRSISKTWPLEFQDIRLNIDTHCRRLREQSAIAHQVETRDMHAKLIDIHGLLDISTSLQRGFGREATTLHPNPSLTKSLPFLKERVLPYLSGNSFSPNQAIELGSAMRERRRARYGTIPHKMWTNPQLQDWISNPASSMVLVKASLRRSESLRDFGLDMIQLLKSSQLTVIWYLGSLSGPTSKAISAVDLIRSFIDQIIQQHKDTSTGWRLNETDFHTCNSKDSWMSLLLAVLKEIPRIAIVVEAQEGLSSILQIMYRIWKYFTDAKITSVIKILVMIQTVHDGSIPAVPEMSHVSQLTFESGTGMRVSPALLKASRRRYGARHFLQGSKPGDLKPFVLRFVSLGCTEG
ncbi:Fc.00g023100.m01.CDS01 [Cosmosporella sp. VM-42]